MILKAFQLPFRGDGSCPCTTTLLGVNVAAPAFLQMCNQFEWFHVGPISEVLAARHRALDGKQRAALRATATIGGPDS